MHWNKCAEILPAALMLCLGVVLPWSKYSTAGAIAAAASPAAHGGPRHARFSRAGVEEHPRSSPSPTATLLSGEAPKRALPELFVMIDPGHGGNDKGALLAGGIAEREVTLGWAGDLRRQLEERGVPARLLRDSDQTLSLDRRAEITNEARPSVYVALHAAPPAGGVRVYAAALPFATETTKGRLVSWENAQTVSLERSRSVARAVANEIRRQDRRVSWFAAPLRPLNDLVIPAIAVEFASVSRQSENQKIETALPSSIAAGIGAGRGQLGARP